MERDCESELSKLNIEQNACIYHFGASVIHGQRSNILRLRIKKQIKNLEKSKLRLEEMNKAISEIQKEIDYINKDARPKFIRYCKIYIDMKKEHARELRKTGNIQYNKMNEKL